MSKINLVNENGELLKEVDLSKKKINIADLNQIEGFKNKKEREDYSKNHFAAMYLLNMRNELNSLSNTMAGHLFKLMAKMKFNSKNHLDLEKKEMLKLLGFKEVKVMNKSLKKIENIYKDNEFNPNFVEISDGLKDKTLFVKLMLVECRKLVDVDVEALGALLKMSMYMEGGELGGTLVKDGKRVTAKELGEIIGIKKAEKIREYIEELEKKEAIIRVRDGKSINYKINPKLLYCGDPKFHLTNIKSFMLDLEKNKASKK